MELKLIRKENNEGAVLGSIHIDGGRDQHDIGTLENEDFIIPEGRYPVRLTYSPKFGKWMPEICDVPNRTGIRFHLGTRPSHSTGCVLLTSFGLAAIQTIINTDHKNEEETFITISSL